jgi:predicted nucleic acid-binding protein
MAIRSVKQIFADTSFLIAFLNPADQWHARAEWCMRSIRGSIVTTDWVLVELGNSFSRSHRELFCGFANDIRSDLRFEIVPADRRTFDAGVALFAARPDKNWSRVDCISFAVMTERGISEALSADRHFEQAGFRVLLK